MVPDPNQTGPHIPDSIASPPETDGGSLPAFDERMLYTVVRKAVKDALLDVIGTVLLVGIAFVLVIAGGQTLLSSESIYWPVIGTTLAIIGLYLAASALEIIPSIRDWL